MYRFLNQLRKTQQTPLSFTLKLLILSKK